MDWHLKLGDGGQRWLWCWVTTKTFISRSQPASLFSLIQREHGGRKVHRGRRRETSLLYDSWPVKVAQHVARCLKKPAWALRRRADFKTDGPAAELIVRCVLAFILTALSLCCLTHSCTYCRGIQTLRVWERVHIYSLQVHRHDLQCFTRSAL